MEISRTMVVASFVNKTLHYYTYNEPKLSSLKTVCDILIRANVTVSQLYNYLKHETRNSTTTRTDIFHNMLVHFKLQ